MVLRNVCNDTIGEVLYDGERKKMKEVCQGRPSEKGGKNPESLGFLSEKRKGVEASTLLPQSDS